MRNRLASLSFLLTPPILIGAAVLIGGAVVAYAWTSTQVAPSSATVAVARGPITQEVTVSGTVKAVQQTNLSFQVSGQVAAIPVSVGQHVVAGQTLMRLQNASESAAVAVAKANLEVQQAKLASLKAGTRPQQLALDQTAVTQAQTALQNALQSAYASADDAVHVKADQVFTNPRTDAKLSVTVADANLKTKVEDERVALQQLFTNWQNLNTTTASLTAQATQVENNLETVGTFLDNLTTALNNVQASASLPAATLSGYQASVQAARKEVTGARTAVITADTAEKSATGALTLAQAGATQNDLNAQQAAVDAASAALASAQATLAKTVMTAPISGVVSAQNANPGETVSPGTPLVSLVADGTAEADAQVSQTDIAKLHVGEKATATFDSYPGVSFDAVVTTVDPAATMTNGVASYGIKVAFTQKDPRLLPGLTANLHITTATATDALLVPTSAVITNGTQKFVYVQTTHGTVKTPVTVGIVGANGTTQVTKGLTEGEQVLTFGASAAANQ